MATTKFLHDIPDQHVHDGILYIREQPLHNLERLPSFKFSSEDILVATYPKSGTTWMCEVADVVHHDGDTTKAKRAPTNKRWPFIEMHMPGLHDLDELQAREPPRQIKTHVSAHFFEKQIREQGLKTILVFRNPKDTLVSFYHFYKMNKVYHGFNGSWDDFFELVKADQIHYGNFFDHVVGWWALRDLPNVEVFMYEDMLNDSTAAVKRVAKFLGKEFTDEKIEEIVQFTSFDSMKSNPSTNYSNSKAMNITVSPFMRKGKVGDWKNYFNDEQNQYIDDMTEKKIKGTGLEFTFE